MFKFSKEKKYFNNPSFFLILIAIVVASCQLIFNTKATNQELSTINQQLSTKFNDYWYKGKAEISSYNISIDRYDEIRKGYNVLVFVTEDFSKAKQVKLDNPQSDPNDKISVLKLNSVQRFQTGIYDYSLMSSIFTPVNFDQNVHSLKNNLSVQDWCGHVFTQLNTESDKGNYKMTSFSYFEQEGDKNESFKTDILEDELFTRLRINPDGIKTGNIMAVPALYFSRLRHVTLKPYSAELNFSDLNDSTRQCELKYPTLDRTLSIYFSKNFPYYINGWKEVYRGKTLVMAQRNKMLMSDYWAKHAIKFDSLRTELGLNPIKSEK